MFPDRDDYTWAQDQGKERRILVDASTRGTAAGPESAPRFVFAQISPDLDALQTNCAIPRAVAATGDLPKAPTPHRGHNPYVYDRTVRPSLPELL